MLLVLKRQEDIFLIHEQRLVSMSLPFCLHPYTSADDRVLRGWNIIVQFLTSDESDDDDDPINQSHDSTEVVAAAEDQLKNMLIFTDSHENDSGNQSLQIQQSLAMNFEKLNTLHSFIFDPRIS